jgi:muramoyltetrapeptide carboxypeptidase LdcA involved in peptidoglycan recycling
MAPSPFPSSLAELIVPRRLEAGCTIAAVTPSWGGPAVFPQRYEVGVRQLERSLGVHVVELPDTRTDAEALRREPARRAADIDRAVADPAIAALITTIGGDDGVRVAPLLDLERIRREAKPFLGYSDATAIHMAWLAAGVRSYYGPSVMAGFGENTGPFPFLVESVRRTLFAAAPLGVIEPNRDGWTNEHLDWGRPELQERARALQPPDPPRALAGRGRAWGRLIGGCAEVLELLRPTPFFPPLTLFDGAILFYETSELALPPAEVARHLGELAGAGVLERLAGIAIGRWGGMETAERFGEWDDAAAEAIARGSGRRDLPILAHLDFGHTDPCFTLPYGALAELDLDACTLCIPERGVV